MAEANGDSWYPTWGKTQAASSNSVADPFSIGISSERVKGEDDVEFTSYTHLRLVYLVAADPGQTILFGIGDSPNIGFRVKK